LGSGEAQGSIQQLVLCGRFTVEKGEEEAKGGRAGCCLSAWLREKTSAFFPLKSSPTSIGTSLSGQQHREEKGKSISPLLCQTILFFLPC